MPRQFKPGPFETLCKRWVVGQRIPYEQVNADVRTLIQLVISYRAHILKYHDYFDELRSAHHELERIFARSSPNSPSCAAVRAAEVGFNALVAEAFRTVRAHGEVGCLPGEQHQVESQGNLIVCPNCTQSMFSVAPSVTCTCCGDLLTPVR